MTRKRLGRPPKPAATRRDYGLTVWLTREQHAAVTSAAEAAGVPASAWLAEAAELAIARGSTR